MVLQVIQVILGILGLEELVVLLARQDHRVLQQIQELQVRKRRRGKPPHDNRCPNKNKRVSNAPTLTDV